MSNESNIVVDVFAGSTVVAKVCIEEGRNSISCDIDPKSTDYFRIQRSRIKESIEYVIIDDINDMFY